MTKNSKTQPVARESASIPEDQLSSLHACFPEAFAEGKVDMDKLRDTLGDIVETNSERYSFTWAGKKEAIRILQTPSRATLVPSKEESVNFDDAQNIFIEGDNLEVLKLLYKSYFGMVKMIYLDPPYNTGHDFIYPDNYADPLDTYLKLTGQRDANGNMLTSNADTNGRYHSAWLSMMYPRLFLARQILRDDGIVFVSINDVELHNLRSLMNEIFGEENFIGQFVWKSRISEDSRATSGLSADHEYILCYGRSDQAVLRGSEKDLEKFANPDNDSRGPWRSADLTGMATKERRPNLHYDLIDPKTGINYGIPPLGWRFEPKKMTEKIAEGRILWPSDSSGRPRHKLFLNEMKSLYKNISSVITDISTSDGTKELKELLGDGMFPFPKPSKLIQLLVEQITDEGDTILDLFAGSGSTAHAVLNQNGERKFILVQLPEPTPEDSPAMKSGLSTIAKLGMERIRRVLKKLKSESGFKVFELAESNYRPWTGIEQRDSAALVKQMEAFNDPLIQGWKPENLLYEIAIKEGFSLNIQAEHIEKVKGQEVHRVTDPDREQFFYLCLDDKLNIENLSSLKIKQDDLFICRDVALDDTAAANLALQCRLKTI